MPYKIIKKGKGYILTDVNGHMYSKRPLTLAKVKKQRTAVILSEFKKKHLILYRKIKTKK